MALDEEENSRLAEILNTLGANRSQLNGKSRQFVDDMVARYDEHGPNTMVSKKQWEWLESLMEQQ